MSRRSRAIAIRFAGVCALLGGCTAIAPRPISPSAQADALVTRRFDAAELRRFASEAIGIELPATGEGWSPRALEASALFWNPRIARSAAALRLAEAAIESARALPNPTLSITPEYSSNPGSASPWSPALQLDWPITTAGKRSRAIDRATADALAARHALAAEVVALERDVDLALLELAASDDAARVSAEEARVAEELATAWRKRIALGAASHAEAAPAESAALDAASAAAAARAREQSARIALAAVLGVPVAQLGEIALAPRVRDDSEVDEARATDALARRSDVLAALARYAGAEAALQGEIAKQFPDLRIGSGYQWDQGQSKFLLGLSIDLPLLDQNEGAIAGALAARSVAAVEFDAVQMAALSEIEAARSERATALEHCAALRATTALVDEQAERADAALVAGALNRLDALAVRGLALRARRDRLEAESSLAVATRRLSASVALAPGEVDGIAGWFARGEQR